MTPESCEVLGIGTPILDLFLQVSSAFLDTIGGAKGGAESVNFETFSQIIQTSGQQPAQAMGGAAANTIKGLAQLGRKCAFLGKIGNDFAGEAFQKEMKALKITSHLIHTNTPTAQVASLISPDQERTMRSYIGEGNRLLPEDITPEVIKSSSLIYIEGYALLFESVVSQVMQLAKEAGVRVAFNLGSFEIVDLHKKLIIDLITDYVDILFANEKEAENLTHLEAEKSCGLLKDLCEIAVVTMGEKGCWVGRGTKKFHQPALPTERVIDTTGAGDLFASGFLNSLLAKKELSACAYDGTVIAASALQNFGAFLTDKEWERIKALFHK